MNWGSSSARTAVLSFYVRSSVTGTFGLSVANGDFNRFRVFSYTIDSADTWERKIITVPGDTSGTWPTDNTLSVRLNWSLGIGTNVDGTVGSYGSSTAEGLQGQTNLIATNNATFYLTGVQFEVDSGGATDFEHVPHDVQLQRCKRYYEKIEYQGMITTMAATATANAYARIECSVEKRADPTVTLPTAGQSSNQIAVLSGAGSYPSTIGNHAVGNPTPLGFRLEATSYDSLETGGGLMLYVNGTVHIEFSSEL